MCWSISTTKTTCLWFIASGDIWLTTIFIVSHSHCFHPYDTHATITNTFSTNTLIIVTICSTTYTAITTNSIAPISSPVFEQTPCYGLCYESIASVVSTVANMIVSTWRSFRCITGVFVIVRTKIMTVCVWAIARIGHLESAWVIIILVCR